MRGIRDRRPLLQDDLRRAIMVGAVERVRPRMITVAAILAGLLPILWSTGSGSEVMQRITVPMIDGMVSLTILTLVVIPAVYGLVSGWGLAKTDLPMESVEGTGMPVGSALPTGGNPAPAQQLRCQGHHPRASTVRLTRFGTRASSISRPASSPRGSARSPSAGPSPSANSAIA